MREKAKGRVTLAFIYWYGYYLFKFTDIQKASKKTLCTGANSMTREKYKMSSSNQGKLPIQSSEAPPSLPSPSFSVNN